MTTLEERRIRAMVRERVVGILGEDMRGGSELFKELWEAVPAEGEEVVHDELLVIQKMLLAVKG